MIAEEMREQLRKPFPPEAISPHPTKSFLSTIKAIYVTERLNDVFGICGWDLEHEIISDTTEYVAVRGRINIIDQQAREVVMSTPYQYGGHKKTGTNTEPADGYKSAMTDCQSKCASYLEIGIDVFKGLVSPPGKEKKTASGKPNEMTKKQMEYIISIGQKAHEMSKDEIAEMVKWKANEQNLSPRHWKMSKLLLPEENFEQVLSEYRETKPPVRKALLPKE